MRTTAIYARISQDREGTEHGIDGQLAACRSLAESLGLAVVAEYVDNNISASTKGRKLRPQFEAMMAAGERGHLGHIVSYSTSRLTRRPLEFERLITLHERHGVVVHTIASGDDDLGTADGRMTARIKASVDAAEAERTGERVSFRFAAKLAAGEDIGGRRPFGFADDRVTPYEPEARMIRDAVERMLNGSTLYAIAQSWSNLPMGKQWRSQTVRDILIRPRNAGRLVISGETHATDRPAIISAAQFDDLLATLAQNPRPKRGPKPQTSTAVTIVKCGACGAGVELSMRAGGTRVIRCSRRGGGVTHPTIAAHALEVQLAQVALMSILDHEDRAERPDVAHLRAALLDAQRRRDRARADVEAYDDEDDRAHARTRVTALSAEVRQCRERLDAALSADIAGRAAHLVDEALTVVGGEVVAGDAIRVWPQWQELWGAWPIADRRELLRRRTIELMPGRAPFRLRVDGQDPPASVRTLESF